MSTISTAPATDRAGRGIAWTAVAGLVLLWGALLVCLYFASMMNTWYFATIGQAADVQASTVLTDLLLGGLPIALVIVVLVLASLRQRWARWVAVVAGIGLGAAGLLVLLVTMSPAPSTVALAAAAIVGGVLLALPTRGRWHRPRVAAAAEPLPA